MRNQSMRGFWVVFLTLLFVAVPAVAQAADSGITGIINRWVEIVEDRVERLMDGYCEKFEGYHERYGSDMPDFCEGAAPSPTPSPSPTPTVTPEPTPTETPEPTATPTATPTAEPTPTEEPTPTPTESPEPSGALVLSEVFYDVDEAHGAPGNEWVEIYNGTDSAVDVSGYKLVDAANQTATIPAETAAIPAGGRLVIADLEDTTTFWGNVPMVVTTGLALNNGSEVLMLKDASDVELDAVHWEGGEGPFDPPVGAATGGASIARDPVTQDTNSADDWTILESPTPGS